ncbi:MAG: hypothetical protein ACRBDL_04805 [Alphaproteobacteria bacterium]
MAGFKIPGMDKITDALGGKDAADKAQDAITGIAGSLFGKKNKGDYPSLEYMENSVRNDIGPIINNLNNSIVQDSLNDYGIQTRKYGSDINQREGIRVMADLSQKMLQRGHLKADQIAPEAINNAKQALKTVFGNDYTSLGPHKEKALSIFVGATDSQRSAAMAHVLPIKIGAADAAIETDNATDYSQITIDPDTGRINDPSGRFDTATSEKQETFAYQEVIVDTPEAG